MQYIFLAFHHTFGQTRLNWITYVTVWVDHARYGPMFMNSKEYAAQLNLTVYTLFLPFMHPVLCTNVRNSELSNN